MSQLASFLLTLMLAFPTAYLDKGHEDADQRKARLTTIAQAIDAATQKATCQGDWAEDESCEVKWVGKREDLALLLVTIGFWESRFALNVHKGECKKWECDAEAGPNGTIIHKARTPWQLQKTTFSEPEWDKLTGTDYEATFHAAYAAAKSLSPGRKSCGNVWGAISIYAGADTCKWKKGRNRVAFYWKLRAKYQLLVKEQEEREREAAPPPENVAALRCFPLVVSDQAQAPRLALEVHPLPCDPREQVAAREIRSEGFSRYGQGVVDLRTLSGRGWHPHLMQLRLAVDLGDELAAGHVPSLLQPAGDVVLGEGSGAQSAHLGEGQQVVHVPGTSQVNVEDLPNADVGVRRGLAQTRLLAYEVLPSAIAP